MTISANASFSVSDSSTVSTSVTETVLAPVSYALGSGRGKLIHPTLGTYLYTNKPTHRVNFDGAPIILPDWLHGKTIGGGTDTLWTGNIRDVVVTERWAFPGAEATLIAHLRYLYTFYANPPDPSAASYVLWYPDDVTSVSYNVAMVGLRAGGNQYTVDMFLSGKGYVATPIELDLRLISINVS